MEDETASSVDERNEDGQSIGNPANLSFEIAFGKQAPEATAEFREAHGYGRLRKIELNDRDNITAFGGWDKAKKLWKALYR
jgi:hypothetical protein